MITERMQQLAGLNLNERLTEPKKTIDINEFWSAIIKVGNIKESLWGQITIGPDRIDVEGESGKKYTIKNVKSIWKKFGFDGKPFIFVGVDERTPPDDKALIMQNFDGYSQTFPVV